MQKIPETYGASLIKESSHPEWSRRREGRRHRKAVPQNVVENFPNLENDLEIQIYEAQMSLLNSTKNMLFEAHFSETIKSR